MINYTDWEQEPRRETSPTRLTPQHQESFILSASPYLTSQHWSEKFCKGKLAGTIWTRVLHAPRPPPLAGVTPHFHTDIMGNDCSHNSCEVTAAAAASGRPTCIFDEKFISMCRGSGFFWPACLLQITWHSGADGLLATPSLHQSEILQPSDLPANITTHQRLPLRVISCPRCRKHDKQISGLGLVGRRRAVSHFKSGMDVWAERLSCF